MGATDKDLANQDQPVDDGQSSTTGISFFELFRFAKSWELLLIVAALVVAFLGSFCWPLILIAYGEFAALLVERSLTRGEVTGAPLLELVGGGQFM